MRVRSPEFDDGGVMPTACTCDGDDRSPALVFEGVPSGAKSLALIVYDPDAPDPARPTTTWAHWVLYELPPACGGLPAGAARLPPGTREGRNDWRRTGYGGPCPPIGRHRYVFTLFALGASLGDLGTPTKGQLEAAMRDAVLARAEVMATYERARR
ncbi:MAG: YbhB/YbcL family Raf kinase inhibitor-like protein [Myxococcaceae bacterium]|jgi:Raf kinase inhibitor-like YbhB/YbcL family protein|nr:YbhB/YbcL family Raf kinase inhibitor-like protein [Myxococcaceae bacterium]MCA3012327.1 YbhB/YbcL family Raf kinase inhibitor-like protein [Myxococcaceae bacterium]